MSSFKSKLLLTTGITAALWLNIAQAMPIPPRPPTFSYVSYNFTIEDWVPSETAEVSVRLTTTVKASERAAVENKIQQKLETIAKTTWRVVSHNQTEDQTGMITLSVVAKARLPLNEVPGLASKLKKTDEEGWSLQLSQVDYSPTEAERDLVRQGLRTQAYQMVKDEIARVEKVYPEAHYQIERISFNETQVRAETKMLAAAAPRAGDTASATVENSEKLKMSIYASLMSEVKLETND